MISKDRQRNRNNRKSKRVILVAYEGKKNKTENNYFSNYNGRDKDYVIRMVPGSETDPINLVKQTIQETKKLGLDLKEDDRAFCIFDTDNDPKKNSQIKKAIELAKNKNIKVIMSSPCIELWFLLHYECTTATMSSEDVIKKLKKHYPKYSKNCDIYHDIFEKTELACKNAKKLEKYQRDNNRDLQSVEANPHSDVYQIIEELNKYSNAK